MGISLKIKGNKRTNEGIGNDLVSLGDNRFPVIDAQYPGAKSPEFIVVRHLPDKSIYTIVSKNVIPCDSNREGTLYISVAVAANEHVDGLFNLLIELQNAYKGSCMAYDGARYQFMSREENPQIFAEIIAHHKVTKYPYRTVVTSDDLSAIAYLFMTPEQISDLLDDPMRGEFAKFGQVVLVPVSDPSQFVSTVNVPAKIWRSYKIYVNGRQTGQTLADPNKTVTITLPETKTHTSASATFSIAQARETRMPGIAVDDVAQIIYINLQPEHKAVVTSSIEGAIREHERQKKQRLYVVIAICAVIVIGVAAFLLLSPSSGEKDNNGNSAGTGQDITDGNTTGTTDDKAGGGKLFPGVGDGDGNAPADTVTGKGTDKDNLPDDEDALQQDNGNATGDGENAGGPDGIKDSKATPDTEAGRLEHQRRMNEINANFDNDKVLIDKAENLPFGKIKEISRRFPNYTSLTGYQQYNRKITFIKNVVDYISGLNAQVKPSEYKATISGFVTRAKELELNGLAARLQKRIEGGPKDWEATMTVKNKF